MAFYSSSFYRTDFGEYDLTPYGGSYDFAPDQALLAYSSDDPTPYGGSDDFAPDQALLAYPSDDFNEPKYIGYDPTPYHHGAYDPGLTRSVVAYSTSTFSEPKIIAYDPTLYGGGYDLALTQFTISYSTSEFNEPEFVEYDPTPYGGGYDPTLTYGKPLPPSDEICYPHSLPDPNALSLDGFPNGSVALPNGKDEVDEPTRVNEEEPPSNGGSGDWLNSGYDNGHGSHLGNPLDSNQGEERYGYICDDYYPCSDYGYGFGKGSEEYSYEYDKQVPQTPCADGSGAMESLCESIFGYWPCLCRKDQKSYGRQEVADEESNRNQWKGTADCLFGNSNPYGNRRGEGGSYGDLIYGYERHYQEPPNYRQVKYEYS